MCCAGETPRQTAPPRPAPGAASGSGPAPPARCDSTNARFSASRTSAWNRPGQIDPNHLRPGPVTQTPDFHRPYPPTFPASLDPTTRFTSRLAPLNRPAKRPLIHPGGTPCMTWNDNDTQWMRRAIALAREGEAVPWQEPDRVRHCARRPGDRRGLQRGRPPPRRHRPRRDRFDAPRRPDPAMPRASATPCSTPRCSLAGCAPWPRSGRRSAASSTAPAATTCTRCISRTATSTPSTSSATLIRERPVDSGWPAWPSECAALYVPPGADVPKDRTVQPIAGVLPIHFIPSTRHPEKIVDQPNRSANRQ